MPDVTIELAEQHRGKSKEELSVLFDQEIEKFSTFMSTIGDWKAVGPLNRSERMLLKTFLVHKFSGKIDQVGG